MGSAVETKPAAGHRRRGLLMAEFNVQVFSDGKVDWGELKRLVRPPEVDARRMMLLLAAGRKR